MIDPQKRWQPLPDKPDYAGFLSYAGLPLAQDPEHLERVDVAIVGAPTDDLVSDRPGTRYAPRAIRSASCPPGAHLEAGIDAFSVLRVVDYGDAAVVPADVARSHEAIRSLIAEVVDAGVLPVVLGGDHSITEPCIAAISERQGPVGLIHFDTHTDTGREVFGVEHSHGTPMFRLVEAGRVDGGRYAQIGLRGYWPGPEEFAWQEAHGIASLFMHEVRDLGIREVVERALAHVGEGPTYITVDVDVLDPAFAPGTGTPEPGGMTSVDLLWAVREVASRVELVGADVVEVLPSAIASADITALVADRIVREVLTGLALRLDTNRRSYWPRAMQLCLDSADRLVELVEERRGPVSADDAARKVLRLDQAVPVGLARSLLDEAIVADARLCWRGDLVALAAVPGDALLLEEATFVVFDLETTGLRPGDARPCEVGAVRIRGLELEERFQTLANPGARLQPAVAALTGLRDEQLRRAPPVGAVVRRFLAFADDAVLVAHNARFDLAFLDNETMRLTGRRFAATVVDTVALARRLLGRRPANLAALSRHFVTDAKPCHRALPDAEATAEILLCLIGLAQERGARTVADLVDLSATRPRRIQGKRSLAFGAPQRPGVYLFRDVHDQVLYVGKARDLRARLRSYFRSDRQRPAVEAALGALHRIEWRVLGSELEAALEELRLIRELRPPANARSARPDRYVYLRRRGESVVCSSTPGPLGPVKSRRRAQLAARALQSVDWATLDDALPELRRKLRRLAADLRFEDAARLRYRIEALEEVAREIARMDRLRALAVCVVVPGEHDGTRRAFFVAKGRVVCVRPFHGARGLEWQAGLAAVARAEPELSPEAADELLAIASFLRRPPPELEVVPLAGADLAAVPA